MKQFKMNEKQRFSIRKFSIGAASVLLGSAFLAISPISVVQANEDNATLSSETLNKTKLKDLIDEIDKKFAKGTYANKTDESVNALKTVLEEARTTLANATTQDQLTTAYRALLTATTQLQSKPKTGNPTPKPGGDTTNGKPTVGKKAENTEPQPGTHSIANTGSHDSRNGQLMDKENPLRTGERSAVTEEPYNSFVFSGSDNLKDNKDHSTLKLFDKTGDGNRNNDSITYGEDSHGKYMEWKSTQAGGGGFKLEIDKELGEEYTIGVKFSFDTTSGSWRKIIDYKNSESDTGFYFYNNGHLRFYPDLLTSTKVIGSGEVVNFIIVRSKNEFAAYIVKEDGSVTKEFSSNAASTLSNSIPYKKDGKTLLGFFFDDLATGSEATTGGRIYSLSIYDKAIDPNKVLEKLNKPKNNELYEPKLKDPLPDVEKGSIPNAEDFIKNTPTSGEPNKLPERTIITWKPNEAPDTNTVGSKPAKILVTYPDGTADEVSVSVNVVSRDFTPTIPNKTPVKDIDHLTIDEVNKIKKAVEDANAGKTVSVDETGKARVTDPTTNISHEIPASDLKVQDFTPAKPAKTPVGDINNLTTDEVNKIKKAVEDANPGKTVTVDATGKARVTDSSTNISHEIPASDLKVQDFTPTIPNKTPVKDIDHLTIDEVNKIKKAVEDANAGKTVSVDETGKARVTDPTTNISHEIPADKLVVKMHISIAPVTPQFKKPTNNTDSKPDAVIPVEDLIRKSEQPSQTVEATNQSDQQIEPSKDKQQSFQNILPNTGTSDKVGLLSVIGVTLLVTSLGTMIPMKKRDE